MSQHDDGTGIWELLDVDVSYEINTVYPYPIRKRSNARIIKEFEANGYQKCMLSNKQCFKHRIIAQQWIENPNNHSCVTHINGNKADNHKENLQWVPTVKARNHSSNQTFVNDIPADAIVVDEYNGNQFEDLYFHDNLFYKYNGINYTVKPRYRNTLGMWYIFIADVSGTRRTINYPKFKREYGLIE